jgi:ammonium transporter, Amt family
MTSRTTRRVGLAALVAAVFAATAAVADAPVVNKGDNAWMLTATVLVLLMTIPGLALFYGGMVRSKNTLSVLTHVFYTVCIVTLIWVIYGYSLAFTGGSPYVGGLSKAFLSGVTPDSKAATFSVGANISEYVYICFQMTFAAITPALIVGAFAERMKFSAVALFIPLWVTLIYFPIAGPARTPLPTPPRWSPRPPTRPPRKWPRPNSTRSLRTAAKSICGAPSISPAAPSCTSIPA